MSGPRYAIYFALAPSDPLFQAASAWLGRDAVSGAVLPHPPLAGVAPDRMAAITAEPRRYGFHATLKPPFRLAAGTSLAVLAAHAASFAQGRAAFVLPPLQLAAIAKFLALVPSGPCPALESLAADCVRAFDRFRAPTGATEIARRRAAGLTPRQDALLAQWGYPHVMDEFRFHMTLTGSLPESEREALRPALARHFAPLLAKPIAVDAISLFAQSGPDAPFVILRRFSFGAPASKPAAL